MTAVIGTPPCFGNKPIPTAQLFPVIHLSAATAMQWNNNRITRHSCDRAVSTPSFQHSIAGLPMTTGLPLSVSVTRLRSADCFETWIGDVAAIGRPLHNVFRSFGDHHGMSGRPSRSASARTWSTKMSCASGAKKPMPPE